MATTHIGRVVFWMTGALLSFSVLAVSIRGLAGALSIFEILTLRSLVGIAILLVLALVRPQLRSGLAPRRMGLNVLRISIHFAAQYAWALAVTLLPLATVFALEFTMPAWVVLLAALVLGEKMTAGRVGVVVLGIIGILIIVRPGLEAFQPASILVLAAAFGFAAFNILTKKISATETAFSIVFWMNVIQLPMGLAGSSLDFVLRLEPWHLPAIAGIGIAGLTAHFCLAKAFRAGDAGLVVPIDFLRLPLIAVVGALFYGEALDPAVFLGGAVIAAGIIWNLRAETRR